MDDMKSRSALGELYGSVTAANGWAMRDVEAQSKRRGEPISKSRIGQLVNANPLEGIQASAIYALAAGLGISADRVALAAVQAMGFRVGVGEVTPAEAIMRDGSLSEDTRRALVSILQAAGDERRRGA